MTAASKKDERLAAHWRTLRLTPGAPECVIEASWRHLMGVHHPDRGGDTKMAQQVNAARDELRGRGAKANDHVAMNINGEAWHVLGLVSSADAEQAKRAGQALLKELPKLPRLRSAVDRAVVDFGKNGGGNGTRAKVLPATPPPPPRVAPKPERKPRPAPVAGKPEGLPNELSFGAIGWQVEASMDIRLTWREFAPYKIDVETRGPFAVDVKASKAVPGRFVVSVAVDWDAATFASGMRPRGYALEAPLHIRWPGGETTIGVRAEIRGAAIVTVSPRELDLGKVKLRQPVKAAFVVVSTADTSCEIETTKWLTRVDSAGRAVDAPLRLKTNVPVRVTLAVQWGPIVARIAGRTSRAPVRPTGKIVVRWSGGEAAIAASMVVDVK